MKTKKTGKKFNLLVKRITSLFKKGDKVRSEPASEKMKNLRTELEVTKGLQVEIKALKSKLKSRKKELAEGVARLEKNSKKVKKNLKDQKKSKSKSKSQKESTKNKAESVKKVRKPRESAKPKPIVTAPSNVRKAKTKAKPEQK